MDLHQVYMYICLALLMAFGVANGRWHQNFDKKNVNNYQTIYIDPTGHGNFSTIQATIDYIPQNNKNWICIYIKAGEYRTGFYLFGKPFIYLKGEGKRKTNIFWDAHDSIGTSATFTSQADNIVAKSLTFTNSWNFPPEKTSNPIRVALAAMISGDKSVFYRCAFLGFQDTLWDVQGRHYFTLCTIQGVVHFIFCAGQSIYKKAVGVSIDPKDRHVMWLLARQDKKGQYSNDATKEIAKKIIELNRMRL